MNTPHTSNRRRAILGNAAFFTLLLLAAAGTAMAQDGCVNSPECPTAVLALVGGAGAALFYRLRR